MLQLITNSKKIRVEDYEPKAFFGDERYVEWFEVGYKQQDEEETKREQEYYEQEYH